jgi:hypothetical protein
MAELVTVYHSTGQAGSLRIKLVNQEGLCAPVAYINGFLSNNYPG